jgi:hypothetical protein
VSPADALARAEAFQEAHMRGLGLLAGAALLAGCAGQQAQPLLISGVNAQTDLAAVGTREAVGQWRNLDADLETAIAAQFVGRIDPLGKQINVDVDEFSLNSFTGAAPETARLAGRVELRSPDGTLEAAYNVTASSQDVQDFLPAGSNVVTIEPTSAEYYQAIVQAFARGAAEVLTASVEG